MPVIVCKAVPNMLNNLFLFSTLPGKDGKQFKEDGTNVIGQSPQNQKSQTPLDIVSEIRR